MSITLLLGGARSGKSRRAEALARNSGQAVLYVATAPMMPDDAEWQARIEKHKQSRPSVWQCVEEPLALVEVLQQKSHSEQLILVDCLTLWLSNMMFEERDMVLETQRLCSQLHDCCGDVVLVSNEVGMGIVPESALGRRFRDEQGRLNQAVAAVADTVELMVAGIPLAIKGGESLI